MAKHPLLEIESLLGDLSGASQRHAIDVSEADDEFRISMDLPGYDKEDISIRTTDHTLHIEAERETETEEGEEETYLRRERRHRSVSRTIQLPETIDETEAKATYQNGVLTVTIPKVSEPEAEKHTIPIDD